jgi:hypothetical protein
MAIKVNREQFGKVNKECKMTVVRKLDKESAVSMERFSISIPGLSVPRCSLPEIVCTLFLLSIQVSILFSVLSVVIVSLFIYLFTSK